LFTDMSELDATDPIPGAGNGAAGGILTQREKRDIQKAQLRPLANRRPELYDEGDLPDEIEFEQMSELYQGTMASIEEGEIVKATVQGIRDNMVVLDSGFKSEGTVPLEEFKELPELKAGDQVEVLLETAPRVARVATDFDAVRALGPFVSPPVGIRTAALGLIRRRRRAP